MRVSILSFLFANEHRKIIHIIHNKYHKNQKKKKINIDNNEKTIKIQKLDFK